MAFQLYSWKAGPHLLWWSNVKTSTTPKWGTAGGSPFSLFTHDLPEPTNPAVKIYTYADDLTIISQHPRVDEAAIQLQDYLRRLEEWLTTNRMSAEGSKSSLTVVTPHNTEYRYKPTITLMGQTIPVNNDKNILGVTIDCGWTFRQHTHKILTPKPNHD